MLHMSTQWLSTGRGKLIIFFSAILIVASMLAALFLAPKIRAASYCQVNYSVRNQWQGGFTADVTITNTSTSAYNGWALAFAFPTTTQKITSSWSATFTQTGQNVTAASQSSINGALGVNASALIGFNASWSNSNPVPTSFTVNGNACGTTSPTATPVPPTSTTGPSPTATSTPVGGNPIGYPYPAGVSHTGNATWFYSLGQPYGGCGIPQPSLDSQNFVALNVQNTPGDYSTFFTRPISSANASKMGFFDNGLNCGRWVKVTIGNYCTGTNDGATNQPFCRNGSWVTDKYNGATLDMLVADSCQDGNAWCRDDPYHLDLAQASLNTFLLNGQPVGDMDPAHWNNRQISWQFEAPPNYTGDIKLGFLQSAGPYWSPVAVTNLPNGIHGVDYFQNGAWVKATTDGDMGQAYLVLPTTVAGSDYQIRVYDVSDQLINNGRVYKFSMPASCGSSCNGAYTPITYTVG
jgi:Cellulose binding domain